MKTERNFRELLRAKWQEGKFLCVGLDSDETKIPKHLGVHRRAVDDVFDFNVSIVDATHDLVCAYKPNIAFYERHGVPGMELLVRTIDYIRGVAPSIPIILDAKRGDIGNTNLGYVVAAFGYFSVDAVTVNPYLGSEALKPFLEKKDKGVIVICKTSNPGAGEFQDMEVSTDWAPDGRAKLYEYVAFKVAKDWNYNENCGVVVGATYPAELKRVRELVEDLPILIPAIGAQSTTGDVAKDVREAVQNGMDSKKEGIILNASRSIIFASKGTDFADAARAEALKLTELINQARKGE